jgi:hypothetical protein
MKGFLATILALLCFYAHAQQWSIKGTVKAADSQQPIALASIFLSNTSTGTTSNEQGVFTLGNIPAGRYELIVSCIGYETFVKVVQLNADIDNLAITLKPKVNELQEVVVGDYEKGTWERWGKFFLDNFIGTSDFAADCSIKNTDAIRFKYFKKSKELEAYADEPLIIENKALGYRIRYQLEGFHYDYTTSTLLYQGYPLFEEMEGKESKQKKWHKRREQVYYGSQMHFMRSLFRNKLLEQGYQVQRVIKKPNLEKKRIKTLQQEQFKKQRAEGNFVISLPASSDSADYYRKILQQPDYTDNLYPALLSGDSIAYSVDSVTVGLDFLNHLQIIYTRAKEPADYLARMGETRSAAPQTSMITLSNKRQVNLLSNGMYYMGSDLLNSGYWAWSEKIAYMLPYDYWPDKQKAIPQK